ncbi:hypothetical protein CDG76_34690 [Nostoc sp. 'Peltigera membranacea cyanobiont' 210A]|uniref:DUF3137 domain-containing protein n=1 Tax=Nostoc sp. 'Peltigera membranacea cyanobiont' 210A TaxID=2014529 RepID=UPI000B953739|nr:DUF3137 domain-containing protein [Nostoc sp. 'Peltigera membranacea cyanobiont' 210A]OYD89549.1 hypothetical protein CDG76_34690 [Nostoc sp. 'Peltigera membranacea cyanobiont' 210A]
MSKKLNPAQNQQLLNGIAKLLEYKNYNLALQGLENFFQNNTEPDTKEYLYARVLLLDAYLYNGRFDQAINLCQELSNSKHQTTQILAHYYLAEIFPEAKPTEQKSSLNSTKSSLNPAQATELINTGYEAITKKRYLEAIQALISFCKATSPDTKEYLKAHKLLIKAYQGNGQINHAIALCQQLLINEDEATRKWARQLLFTELFIDNIDVSATPRNPTESEVKLQIPSETLPEEPEPAIEKFTPKTLKEFKVFCQTNLLSELKVFESRRKQALLSIITLHILFLSFLIITFKLLSMISFDIKDYIYIEEPSLFENHSTPIDVVFICIVINFLFSFSNYSLVFLLVFWIWIFFYSTLFQGFFVGFTYKISEKIFTFVNQNKNLKYLRSCSQQDNENTINSFQHSQLFKGLINPNNIDHNVYIYGKINGLDVCFSNIRVELELKHDWTNFLDIIFFMVSRYETIIQSNVIYLFIFSILRVISLLIFVLPFTFSALGFRIIKIIPYIINHNLRGKNIEYKKFESEVLKNQFTRTSLIFKGLFFKAKFNKNLRTVTIVQPKVINANIHTLNHAKKQVIKLEDPEFAKFFTVYGDDQIEARYVLSTSLMDKIVNFRNKTNRNIYISFVDDMIYIAIEEAVENNILDPNLYKRVLKFAPLREYFETFNLMLGIVEDLNLDRRI